MDNSVQSELFELETLEKECVKCKVVKPIEEYYSHPATKDGKFSFCKPCHSVRENLKLRLKKGFNSLKTDYCECCGITGTKVQLDHCHESGMFRGFLCRPCNAKIGHNGDSYEAIKALDLDSMYEDYLKTANYRMGKWGR